MKLIKKELTLDEKIIAFILRKFIVLLFSIQRHMSWFRLHNYQDDEPAIYALWHAHQCSIFGLKNRKNTNVLISRSMDGEIIDAGAKYFGFKTIRGSQNRAILDKGGVSSTIEMMEALERGENVAVMVDGPNGPAKKAKKGIIALAKHTGAPIIPMNWYSPSKHMIKLPTWDKLQFPVGIVKIANCYSEPIYVPKDATPEQEKEILLQIENALNKLDENAPKIYLELWGKDKWTKEIENQ